MGTLPSRASRTCCAASLRFTGEVDPRSIQPGNTVQSARIANVRVQHKGDGQMADTQGIGWLARFFLNLLPI